MTTKLTETPLEVWRLGIGKAFGVPETVRQEPRFDRAILCRRAHSVGLL